MSEHVTSELGLVLATLPDAHPDVVAAHAHAARCPDCARALRRGRVMLELLDAQALDVPVDPRLKQRIMRAVGGVQKREQNLRSGLSLALGSVASLAFAWWQGRGGTGLFPAHGHFCLMWELLGCGLALTAASVWALRTAQRPRPLGFAVAAMGGALVLQAWLQVVCPTHDALAHVLVFHVTGVVLSAGLGLWHGQRMWKGA